MGRGDAKASNVQAESRLAKMAVTAIERITIAEHPYTVNDTNICSWERKILEETSAA